MDERTDGQTDRQTDRGAEADRKEGGACACALA